MRNLKKHLEELRKKGLVFHTHGEVFGKLKDQSKEYQKAYKEEGARLTLVRQIRELRLKKKLTQKMVAKRANMPQSVIARLESGEHSFSLDTLQRIASVYNKKVALV
ncbi:MAG: transcriptional regulator [Candidatus Taylorbacteria bacterium CG11_big_fil_rev_8_21_14_0_20_46_11]|uniref:Transcriptional regulator n=1 Tax=Candidatus Taylorbacteria bacterium CG11_big_fil_rev_8_21_14_0_20_46_11 TaxID=1975025 RepID=A0A2H0KCL1_9BACT|nr:MAG: transcriptional regulator [Candidatus Taylorbacteria bacterium CG11_big_fil_rev_8_21_14_0_20_46_11]